MQYALIDMGSNSIRLTVYDMDASNFKILFKEKRMAGLAGYVEHGRLTPDGIDCACQCLREFQNTLSVLQIEHLAVFATASLRNISNTAQAVTQIAHATGITVSVLTGEEEAACGFCGATCDVAAADGLFVDVGGASTELVAFANRQIEQADSVPVGSLKLYRDCVKKILPGKSSCRRLAETIEAAFDRPALQTIPKRPHMVCVGGTARAALRLCRKLCGLPEDCRTFTRAQLDALAHELCGNSRDSADLILRYAPERIHTLIPGVMVLQYLTDRFDTVEITVSHYSVREGYLRRTIQPGL